MIELSQSSIYITLKKYKEELKISPVEFSTICAVLKEIFYHNKQRVKAHKNSEEPHNDVSTVICTMIGVKVSLIDSLGCVGCRQKRYIFNINSI